MSESNGQRESMEEVTGAIEGGDFIENGDECNDTSKSYIWKKKMPKALGSEDSFGSEEKGDDQDSDGRPRRKRRATDVFRMNQEGKRKSKRSRRAAIHFEEPVEYEVDKIIDHKKIDNVMHYRIRWKGYTSSDDTWETKTALNCDELLRKYNDSIPKSGTKKRSNGNLKDSTDDLNHEWEVQKIIKGRISNDGDVEYLIRWKSCSADEDTWEPEENLNCTALLNEFKKKYPEMFALQRKPRNRRRHR